MKKINFLVWAALVLAVIGVGLSIYYVVVIVSYFGGLGEISKSVVDSVIVKQFQNNIGDFLWGTLGVLFTLTTTIFLFVTYSFQKKQIEDSKQDASIARFETTYFNLLGMLKQVQDNVNSNIKSNLGDEKITDLAGYYKHFKSTYNEHLNSDNNLKTTEEKFDINNGAEAQIEQLRGVVASEYENLITETTCHIGFFFRYIYNSIKFVVESIDDEKGRELYLNLLQAQLSNEELALIFYDAISKYGRNKNNEARFQEYLETTNFLENLDEAYLLNKNHHYIYSHTVFKFLNRDETNKVVEVRKQWLKSKEKKNKSA